MMPQRSIDPLEAIQRENALLLKEVERLRQERDALRAYRTMAFQDPLTGLRNRRYLMERLTEELGRFRRTHQPFSVAVLDLDDFKRVNDCYGHAKGDETLRWVGTFLTSSGRDYDACCRIGGDEFVVLLPDVDRRQVPLFIARLRARLATANLTREFPVALSVGTSTCTNAHSTSDTLLAEADAAMFESKRVAKLAACAPAESPVRMVAEPANP